MDEGGKRDDEEEKSLMRWKETGCEEKNRGVANGGTTQEQDEEGRGAGEG